MSRARRMALEGAAADEDDDDDDDDAAGVGGLDEAALVLLPLHSTPPLPFAAEAEGAVPAARALALAVLCDGEEAATAAAMAFSRSTGSRRKTTAGCQ